MRDIVFLLFFVCAAPISVLSPFAAFLLWTWADLTVINNYVYSFMGNIKYVQLFAVVTLVVVALNSKQLLEHFKLNGMIVLMVAFVLHGLLSAVFAYPGLERNWEIFSNVAKTVLLCILISLLLTSRERINLYIMCLVTAVGFHGLLDGLKMVASGGAHNVAGVAKFGDNNHYALILLMTMPLCIYLARQLASKYARWMAMGVVGLMLLAVVGTHSRGAFIATLVGGAWYLLKSKKKLRNLGFGMVATMFVLAIAPANWFERIGTIQEAQNDSSFMGRVAAWKFATAIAVQNPVLGGGFYAGQAPVIFDQFKHADGLLAFVETPVMHKPLATHSIYFQVLGDLGFMGLLLYLSIGLYVFLLRGQIARNDKMLHGDAGWATDLANLIAMAMIFFAVGGGLLSLAYYEMPFYLAMLMKVVQQVGCRPDLTPRLDRTPTHNSGESAL